MGVAKALKRSAVVVFSGFVMTLASAGVVDAAKSVKVEPTCDDTEVNGDFIVNDGPGFPGVKPVADDLCIIELPATFVLGDDLQGEFFTVFEIEHYGACDQYAEEYFYSEGTYKGSVLGFEGTFSFEFEGTIDLMGHASGELTINPGSGTDGLEGISGEMTLAGPAGQSGSYSGEIRID